MKVKGNRNLLQSNLNSYCDIVGISGVHRVHPYLSSNDVGVGSNGYTMESLRTRYYKKFLEDAKGMMVSARDYSLELSEEEVVNDDEIQDSEFAGRSSSEQVESNTIDNAEAYLNGKTIGELPIGEVPEEAGAIEPEVEWANRTHGVFLEDIVSDIQSVKKEDRWASHGVFLEDVSFIEPEVRVPDEVTPNMYLNDSTCHSVNHGVFIEDLSIIEYNTKEHGVFLEDISIVESEQTSDTPENIEDDVMEESFEEYLEEEGEDSIYDSSVEEDLVEDEDGGTVYNPIENDLSEENLVEDDLPEGDFAEEENEDEDLNYDSFIEDDSLEDSSEEDISTTFLNERELIENPPQLSNAEKVTEEKVKEPNIDVPKELRQFIKKNLGCTVEEALKYYPSKEIEREIKIGKIYKKKGKLYI